MVVHHAIMRRAIENLLGSRGVFEGDEEVTVAGSVEGLVMSGRRHSSGIVSVDRQKGNGRWELA